MKVETKKIRNCKNTKCASDGGKNLSAKIDSLEEGYEVVPFWTNIVMTPPKRRDCLVVYSTRTQLFQVYIFQPRR